MPTPEWWPELMAVSDLLAAEDRAEVEAWRRDAAPDDEGIPVTVRLGHLGRAFAEHAAELTTDQRRRFLDLLERVLTTGSQSDADAVATGFLEALLSAYDRGFDLRSLWPDLGPKSRAYCLAWNDFTGSDTPDWMRAAV